MAKGQKRGNREPKKPKKPKSAAPAPTTLAKGFLETAQAPGQGKKR